MTHSAKPEDKMQRVINMDEDKNEGQDVLELLPEEVWELVFSFFQDSSTHLRKCCLASTTWNNMLSVKKPIWLFQEIFPHLYYYLKNEEILKCRLICTNWKTAVDKLIEDHPCQNPLRSCGNLLFSFDDFGRESVYYPLIAKKLNHIRFNWIEELKKFCNQMNPSRNGDKNPIIGRSICFYARLEPEWMRNGLLFLSMFGKHIWHFTFQGPHPPQVFIQYLKDCLEYLPNVKKLNIYSSCELLVYEPQEVFDINTINECKLVETLEVSSRTPWMMHLLMKRFSSQLRRLELQTWDFQFSNEEYTPMANLMELTLSLCTNAELENLNMLKCPLLRRLTLYLTYESIDIFSLTRALETFSASLHTLKIFFSSRAELKENSVSSFTDLVLPKLNVLVLVNAHNLHVNWLECVQSIEYFYYETWCCRVPEPHHINAIFLNEFSYNVNPIIWKHLPAMRRLIHMYISPELFNPNSKKRVYDRDSSI